jgi:hypothetical protein
MTPNHLNVSILLEFIYFPGTIKEITLVILVRTPRIIGISTTFKLDPEKIIKTFVLICSPTYELDEVQESDRKDAATRQRNVVEAAGQEMAAASPQLHQASWLYRQRGDI